MVVVDVVLDMVHAGGAGKRYFWWRYYWPFRNSKKDWVLVYTLLKLHLIKKNSPTTINISYKLVSLPSLVWFYCIVTGL